MNKSISQLVTIEIFLRSTSNHLTLLPPASGCCCLVAKLCPTLRHHQLQPTRLPCPSLGPRVWSNSCPLSQWCHPTISSSAACLSSCLQSFPGSGSFPVSQLFASGSQSIGASASASVIPMNIQGWFPLGLTIWSPCSPRDSQESSPAPQFESISSSALGLLYGPALTSIHDYWKNHSLTLQTFVVKVISLLLLIYLF